MASIKQIAYFKVLLENNGLESDKYDLFEEIPHHVISPAIDALKKNVTVTYSEWNNLVQPFKVPEYESVGEDDKYNFGYELSLIKSPFIRDLVKVILDRVPDYFWVVPASSTGKYHPEYSLGVGGLIRHTRANVKIANELLSNPGVQDFGQDDKDVIIGALILHDTMKYGPIEGKYTKIEHPLLVEDLFEDSMVEGASEPQMELLNKMFNAIRSHMGPWTQDRNGNEILPRPVTPLEKFVHMCDYLSSRKWLEVKF